MEGTQDKIDKFLDNKMTPDEASHFEAELKNMPELQKLVDFNKAMRIALKEQVLKEKLAHLKTHVANKTSSVNTQVPKSNFSRILTYALITILTGFLLYFVFRISKSNEKPPMVIPPKVIPTEPVVQRTIETKNPTVSTTDSHIKADQKKQNIVDYAVLAKKYFIAPSNLASIVRGNRNTEIQAAAEAYKNNQYREALHILNNQSPDDQQALYLKAHALYKLNKINEASSIFKSFADDDMSDYHFDAQYYLLICYIQNQPLPKSEIASLAKSMLTHNHPQADNVKSILEVSNR
jgi:hypothetical protein